MRTLLSLTYASRRAFALAAIFALSGVTAAAEPALWVMRDADSEIYLFGTVHILPPDLEWRTADIQQAFESAGTIWFEAPAADPAAQFEMIQLIAVHGLNPAGTPLSSQLSEETRSKLTEILARFGIGAADLDAMRPWMAATTLSLTFIQSRGYDPESGVEFVMWREATDDGKQIRYFESMEEQIRFMSDLPPEIEVEFLEQTIDEFDDAPGELDGLVSAWAKGDIATIDTVMNAEGRESAPEMHQRLLVDRNLRWVETIRELMAGSGSHFIAVGAGHMAGSEGVVEMLRSEGFEITGP